NFTLLDNPTADPDFSGRSAQGYGVINRAGPCTITANFSGSGTQEVGMLIHEISGVDTLSPLDGHAMQHQFHAGTGTDAVTSGNITTTQVGDYIMGVSFDFADNLSLTSGTGYT